MQPIATVLRLLAALAPALDALVKAGSEEADEKTILAYLNKVTLVGLLPVPHPILVRQYVRVTSSETLSICVLMCVFTPLGFLIYI